MAYKYRLYPNAIQATMLNKHFGCARWVWNWALAQKVERYEKHGERVSRFDLQGQLPRLKAHPDTEWLGEVNSQSLQSSLAHLDEAFTRFFRGEAGFPRFKSKHRTNAFACPQNVVVNAERGRVRLPKIGWVKAKLSRSFADGTSAEGTIKTCTVSREPTGKVFIAILVDDGREIPAKAPVLEGTAVGVDLGLKDFAALSPPAGPPTEGGWGRGEKVPNPRHLEKALARLRVLQRRLSRKQQGSRRRNRARLALARQHEKVRNQRRDFLHKLSTRLIREHDTVCLETLCVTGMVKNRCLARHISGASWSEFVRQVEYKAEWYGKNVLRIGRFEPSSRTCTCGAINRALTLADRRWQCEKCGQEHDRDLLAAQNIKRFALSEVHLAIQDRHSGSGRPGGLGESSALAEA